MHFGLSLFQRLYGVELDLSLSQNYLTTLSDRASPIQAHRNDFLQYLDIYYREAKTLRSQTSLCGNDNVGWRLDV